MSDYISRGAANEACREAVRRYPNSFYNGIEAARDAIRKLPAADVRPVVRGKWIGGNGVDYVRCSCCHKNYDWVSQAQYYNFCPNCGADMMSQPPKEET